MKIAEQIEKLAEKAFAEHVITTALEDGLFRHYRCAKPGTGIYAFNITTIPGRLIVTGDIGTLVVERLNDMFEWAPSAVESIDYFASKVPGNITVRAYDPEAANEFLAEEQTTEGTESDRARIAAELEEYTFCEHTFQSELYSSGLVDGCDWPELRQWTPTFLWCREAVRWFFREREGGA